MSQEHYKKRLKALMDRPENQVCSDCPERQPRWASLIVPPPGAPQGTLPMGAFCCLECSGSHRRLGVHVSFVRSITLDQWKENEVLAMENGGNKKVNAIYEAKLQDTTIKPNHHATGQVRERFIRDKYERRKYFDAEVLYRVVTLGDDSIHSAPGNAHVEVSTNSTVTPSTAVRQPSEAAKLRAENRRNRITSHTNSSLSDTSRPTVVQIPPKVPQTNTAPTQPIIDLLDFSFISAPAKDLDPPPRPPSVQASPTLDLFKSLNLNDAPVTAATATTTNTEDTHDIFGDIYNRKSAASSSIPNPFPPQEEQKKTLTSNEILAMFNTPPGPPQQVHTSTSTPNLNTPSRFDFFDNIPVHNMGPSSSSSSSIATKTHHLHTHHSFSYTNPNSVGVSGAGSTPYSVTTISHPYMGSGSTHAPMGSTASYQRPMNIPSVPMTTPHVGIPNTQSNYSSLYSRGSDSMPNEHTTPMGGVANNFSIMGGVENGSGAAFTVMGGNTNPSNPNSAGFGALNSFR